MYGVNGLFKPGKEPKSKNLSQSPDSGNQAFPNKKMNFDLTEGMLEFNHMKKPRGWVDTLASVVAHGVVLAALILIPLLYTQAFNLPKYETTFITAPAPPPPPPPPAAVALPLPHKPEFQPGKLYAPTVIPNHIANVREQTAPQQIAQGVPGGVIGGVPGGQLGGVLGGILGSKGAVARPHAPAKPEVPQGPVRVGGRVQAPRLINRVQPTYPPLAMETRTQGNVVVDCVIDPHGNVTEMKVVSGPPLLIQAAMNAVSEWKYQPTLLNGRPVSVEMLVTVHFHMDQ